MLNHFNLWKISSNDATQVSIAIKKPQIPVISSLQAPGPGLEDLKRQDNMDSADVAEDSKEASTETMKVAVSEEDLEDTMVGPGPGRGN